jgi:hypothetical protein
MDDNKFSRRPQAPLMTLRQPLRPDRFAPSPRHNQGARSGGQQGREGTGSGGGWPLRMPPGNHSSREFRMLQAGIRPAS